MTRTIDFAEKLYVRLEALHARRVEAAAADVEPLAADVRLERDLVDRPQRRRQPERRAVAGAAVGEVDALAGGALEGDAREAARRIELREPEGVRLVEELRADQHLLLDAQAGLHGEVLRADEEDLPARRGGTARCRRCRSWRSTKMPGRTKRKILLCSGRSEG